MNTEKRYLWNSSHSESQGDCLFAWRDVITRDLLAIPERHWKRIVSATVSEVREWEAAALDELVRRFHKLLVSSRPASIPENEERLDHRQFGSLPSFRLSGATIADRALMCSAVAYCLAFDLDGVSIADLNRLRLSAMTLELSEVINTNGEDVHPDLAQIHERVRAEAESLFDSIWTLAGDASFIEPENPQRSGASLEGMLYCAALISSNRLGMKEGEWKQPNPAMPDEVDRAINSIQDKAAFHNHPLAEAARAIGDRKAALVYGGATRIKAYFLESLRLPEIRGASTLLDQINLEDAPALFGYSREPSSNWERREAARSEFKERAGLARDIDAPECVIYANGGNILAFAPVSAASEIAQEIENIYTRETLVANSSAVCEAFDLIELHYGLRPLSYWTKDFIEDCEKDEELRQLIGSTYRVDGDGCKKEFGEEESRKAFLKKKCFGELGTALAVKFYHRRDGNPFGPGAGGIEERQRPLRAHPPHYETLPHSRRCSSCERRPSVIQEPRGQERYLCAACARKRLAGRLSESPRSRTQYGDALRRLRNAIDWPEIRAGNWMHEIHNWVSDFEKFLEAENRNDYWSDAERQYEKNGPQAKNVAPSARKWVMPAQDLAELADRNGFVGLIYADGNNVGSIIEQVETAVEYRQFAERMFEANQAAVFKALAEVLRPHKTIPNDERPDAFKKALADREGRIMVHPFEILSIGGDDFMLFVPGDRALEIAKRIGSNLEERFPSRWLYETIREPKDPAHAQRYRPDEYDKTKQPRVSLSAGVIIAGCHTPIYLLEDLAEQLLKSAKKRAKRLEREHCYHGGTVDFMVLKSVSNIISEVQSFRDQVLESRESIPGDGPISSETLRLYARPYTLHELGGLLQTAREFQEVALPRSQLYDIRNDTLNRESGRTISTLNYLYFRARTQNKYAKVIRKHFEEYWWGGEPAEWLHPWREVSDAEGNKVYETILYDLIEVYDFVEHGGEKYNGDQAKSSAE